MFRAILYSQWKWSRVIVVLGTVGGFALPLVSLQGAARADRSPLDAEALLHAVQGWGVLYPLLATAVGLLVAVATWAPDHRGRHIHALTLPLPRWRYVLLRFATGATVLAGPILGVCAGALIAVAAATLPPGLHGYPLALALRFALAVLVAYGLFFAISAGTARTAGIILGVIAAAIIVQVFASVANLGLNIMDQFQLVLVNWPGPLAVFTGRWMLIDV